jgi:hypothetical protein
MKALLHNLESFILIFFSAEPEHRKIFPRQLGFCTAGGSFITDFLWELIIYIIIQLMTDGMRGYFPL